MFLRSIEDKNRIIGFREAMNRFFIHVIIVLSFLAVIPLTHVFAQEQGELELRLSRTFGYSSGSGKIQGTFTATVTGPHDMTQVYFYLDDQLLGELRQSPFSLRFNTDSYNLGVHTIYAFGQTSEGGLLRSNEIRVEFVSAEEGWQAVMRFAVPIFVIALGAVALSFVFMLLSAGKQKTLPPGSIRKYGISGGAICPKCGRPFTRHFLSLNMGAGKLERCPYCGKWSIVKAASLSELRRAEIAELEVTPSTEQTSSQQDFLRDLDDSRFQDQ